MRLIDVIPTPKGIVTKNERKVFPATICGKDYDIGAFLDFCEKKDVEFTVCDDGIVKIEHSDFLEAEEYRISVSDDIKIYFSNDASLQYALATLYQMILRHEDKILVPVCTITDKPDLKFRSILLDCARSLHTPDEIAGFLDLCWLYKLKYMQLSFANDEAFRLPMKKYPKLTSEVAYTYDDIKKIRAYAKSRYVSIIPELDTPGHSTVMQNAYPEIFGQKGILAFTKESIDACADIYNEICDMFEDCEYVHIGGDEGRMGWWIDWEECIEYGKTLGINPEDSVSSMSNPEYQILRYLAYFIKFNAEVIKSRGKKAIVWEGFHKITNDIIPKDVVVMAWETAYQLPQDLIAAGFDIINCSWIPTYVVVPVYSYTKKECFDWDVFSFGTINENSPYFGNTFKIPYSDKIIGAQMNSWGDTIETAYDTPQDGHDDEYVKIQERLPALAENFWNREKRISWEDFDS